MILTFLATTLGRWVASALVVLVAFGGWLFVHDRKVERRGAEKAVAKIEKSNAKAVQTVDRARAASRDSGMRGKRDPYSLD
jgi:hypothetical protein